MRTLRVLSLLALGLGFAQVVFGAIVRITGSGMGCGDHWPDCYHSFTPSQAAPTLLVEISHRYGAAALSLAIVLLVGEAFRKRGIPGVSGRGGVLRAAIAALGLVVTAALFGAVTVKMDLNPFVVVTHLAIAMSLLAILALSAIRAGAFGAGRIAVPSQRTARASLAALVLTFAALILGALTANIPGAPLSCQGFPWCRVVAGSGLPLWIQIAHRAIAVLLLGHLTGMAIGSRKRAEPAPVRTAALVALGIVVLQLIVAGAMVELHLPASLRSLHQAVGTALWICVTILLALAGGPTRTGELSAVVRESPSRGEFATPEGVST
jgi:heme A synthase